MFFLFPSEVHEGKGPFLSDLLPSQAQKNDVWLLIPKLAWLPVLTKVTKVFSPLRMSQLFIFPVSCVHSENGVCVVEFIVHNDFKSSQILGFSFN